ncbi:MAG: isoprenyl transferase [Candidatus Omnitrophica bacterium]|nr:isoprenyl transferase [Candidatus Omnitrophota bacterium]MCB9746878.1 isoprenyl transferase [Candidatus Omnitrophota bacterium]
MQLEKIPQHVAIIMDGNGRWAKSRQLPRTKGHLEGVKRVEEIVDVASEIGIKVLTLYTFSTENWKRPKSEVSMLMNLLAEVLKHKIDSLKKSNIRFQTIGRKDRVPDALLNAINQVAHETKENTGLILNLAFNYGARLEIIDAIKQIALLVKNNQLAIENIDDFTVSRHLYTYNLPDPDLLIRTSGEQRISNFLLWQLSYAEFYFTQKYWPDFDADEFKNALNEFQNRERRYGKIGKNDKEKR